MSSEEMLKLLEVLDMKLRGKEVNASKNPKVKVEEEHEK